MMRCLQLARQGAGQVSPNPMVGAVLVHEGRIIGEGYHMKYGGPHAEVNALLSVAESDRHLVPDSVIYVTLEPCAHQGKTPPCTDLILSQGIRKVVIGCRDPFPAVNGKGIERLLAEDVEVVLGVMEKECRELNRRFLTFHEAHRPWVILKWAQTANGMMGKQGERLRITSDAANRLAHRWRTEEDAILVGTETALKDDPQLTARLWPGKNPLRVVLDLNGRLPKTLNLFSDGQPTLVLRHGPDAEEGPVLYREIHPDQELTQQLSEVLYREGLQSLIVEGGAKLLKTFLDANAWDEARIFTHTGMNAPEGIPAPQTPAMHFRSDLSVGADVLAVGFRILDPRSSIFPHQQLA